MTHSGHDPDPDRYRPADPSGDRTPEPGLYGAAPGPAHPESYSALPPPTSPGSYGAPPPPAGSLGPAGAPESGWSADVSGAPPPSGFPDGGGAGSYWPPPKSRRTLLIAIVVAVVAVGAIVVAVLLANRLPEPTPVVPGDDSALNSLAQSCFDGDMGACDELFRVSPVGSEYESYGNTCGGRVPVADVRQRLCVDIF